MQGLRSFMYDDHHWASTRTQQKNWNTRIVTYWNLSHNITKEEISQPSIFSVSKLQPSCTTFRARTWIAAPQLQVWHPLRHANSSEKIARKRQNRWKFGQFILQVDMWKLWNTFAIHGCQGWASMACYEWNVRGTRWIHTRFGGKKYGGAHSSLFHTLYDRKA